MSEVKQCPSCSKDIRSTSIYCQHCGHTFPGFSEFVSNLESSEKENSVQLVNEFGVNQFNVIFSILLPLYGVGLGIYYYFAPETHVKGKTMIRISMLTLFFIWILFGYLGRLQVP